MKRDVTAFVKKAIEEVEIDSKDLTVELSDTPEHGEYTTNIALKLAGKLHKSPMTVAESIKNALKKQPAQSVGIDHVDIVAPGFINIFLTDEALLKGNAKQIEKKPQVMVEFAHPNTHKAFHIGHLRNIITGECIVRLLEANGHSVIRANYQGDVGLHIAKALYGLLEIPDIASQISCVQTVEEKTALVARAYVAGNTAYEETEDGKEKINAINKQIYAKDPAIYSLYQKTRNWSLEYFDSIYKRVGTRFDRFYFESETYEIGKNLVEEYVKKGVFEHSNGAIIFPGEKFGLHRRVFVTSEGNPTYEGKDVGLAKLQFDEYNPNQIIHCVASEQIEYFRVIFEAIAQVFPETRGRQYHLVYGWVRLKEGKMSSRTGNVVLGEWLLNEIKKELYTILKEGDRGYDEHQQEDIAEKTCIAAVKYAFLKVSTPQEIAFDIKESVNINGDSGPYLLYTCARAKSVMEKSLQKGDKRQKTADKKTILFNQEEHDLARLLFYFPEIVAASANHFAPNMLCEYLFKLAQSFNLFYATHPIIGNSLRLALTKKTADTLAEGLTLLGIEPVQQM